MFNNVGGKLMGLAKVLCWLGIIGSVIGAIFLFAKSGESQFGLILPKGTYVGLGVALLILGPLFSWLSSLSLYGLGECVKNSSIMVSRTGYGRVVSQERKSIVDD